MEAEKPVTMEDLNKEFSHACAQLGEAHFKMKVLEVQETELLNKISEINKKAYALKEKEKPANVTPIN